MSRSHYESSKEKSLVQGVMRVVKVTRDGMQAVLINKAIAKQTEYIYLVQGHY